VFRLMGDTCYVSDLEQPDRLNEAVREFLPRSSAAAGVSGYRTTTPTSHVSGSGPRARGSHRRVWASGGQAARAETDVPHRGH
jgi:hypothetical protein